VDGYLSPEELKYCQGCPSPERMEKGPVAVVECTEEIPCNPCEEACPRGAIVVGSPITNVPVLIEDKCTGCGVCVAQCPGLAIFVLDLTHADGQATVSFPYEYLPLPDKGQQVTAVDRAGEPVCEGTVVKVANPGVYDRTPVVTVAVPREHAARVRGISRLGGGQVG